MSRHWTTCPEQPALVQIQREKAKDAIEQVRLSAFDLNITQTEQKRRFDSRALDPLKRWKLSPVDKASLGKWDDYTEAKEAMFFYTDTAESPWTVVKSDCKKRARLNCISHLLSMVDYEDLTPTPDALPPRPEPEGYVRPPLSDQTFVPDVW